MKIQGSFLILFFSSFICSLFAQDISAIVKQTQPSVVLIITYDKNDSALMQGTGFFINNQGALVSNGHVFEGANKALIKTFDGKTYPIKDFLSEDKTGDLLLFSADIPNSSIIPLNINPGLPLAGDKVIVIGNPCGLEQTVSDGIVSSIRNIPDFGNILQITAPISAGSSGSPVMNANGEVIGVATLNVSIGQNLNFAIPSERLVKLTANLSISQMGNVSGPTEENDIDEIAIGNTFPINLMVNNFLFTDIEKFDTSLLKTAFVNILTKNKDFTIIDRFKNSNITTHSTSISFTVSHKDSRYELSFISKNIQTGEILLSISDNIKCSSCKFRNTFWPKFCSICIDELYKFYLFEETDKCFTAFEKTLSRFFKRDISSCQIGFFYDYTQRALLASANLQSMVITNDKSFFKHSSSQQIDDIYGGEKCDNSTPCKDCSDCGFKNIAALAKIADNLNQKYSEICSIHDVTPAMQLELKELVAILIKLRSSFHMFQFAWKYSDWQSHDTNRLRKYKRVDF